MTQEEFLRAANGRARTRIFGKSDYTAFCEALCDAQEALSVCVPFYWASNAGGVANCYGYTTTSARCGVYVLNGQIHTVVDRRRVSGRSVPCVFYGGDVSYQKAFREQPEIFRTAPEQNPCFKSSARLVAAAL